MKTKRIIRISLVLLALFSITLPGPAQTQNNATTKTDTTVLNTVITDISTQNRKTSDEAFELNRANQEMNDASNASDATVRRARRQVDSANLEAQSVKDEAATRANQSDRENSWSSTMGDAVVDGVDSGAATLGGAIGAGINAASRDKE